MAAASERMEQVKKATREPKYSKFTQQELPAYKPLLTPKWIITLFFGVGIVFIPIGAVCLAASKSVVEVSRRYDDVCVTGSTNAERDAALLQAGGNGTQCEVTLTIRKRMKAPVYLYYELDNFYQNHRRYVKSRSDQQLRGENPSASALKDCEPQLFQNDDPSKLIDPCGLVAWSFFNDTYQVALTPAGGSSQPVVVAENNIAWKSDREKKFGTFTAENFNNVPALRGGGTLEGPVRADEHFIVWMRTAALPRFRKLWGRIESDLPAGSTLTVSVANRYNTYRFGGAKAVVLSTASWLGGRNDFLGIGYLTVGAASLGFGLGFFVIQWKRPRKLGDVAYLSWNKQAAVQGGGLDAAAGGSAH